jgi:crotonobetainyl-CoA:carnitine CoA-transferase CaiB-like acyl-CoA transferase
VQAISGLTFTSGLPGMEPAGWGYSYMDHTGAYYMAIAIMAALYHRERTGEGQWVDMATTEVATTLNGPALLDYTMNGRPLRRPGMPNSNRDQGLELGHRMVPHGIYPAKGEDRWVAIACRDQRDWEAMCDALRLPWMAEARFRTRESRLEREAELDSLIAEWTRHYEPAEIVRRLRSHGVPASAVVSPEERIDQDENTAAWGLWPEIQHTELGGVRVDGLPVHLSETDWSLKRGAGCLGEHNQCVLGDVLGYPDETVAAMQESGAI